MRDIHRCKVLSNPNTLRKFLQVLLVLSIKLLFLFHKCKGKGRGACHYSSWNLVDHKLTKAPKKGENEEQNGRTHIQEDK
jgi:hypothetical protein